MAAAAVGSVPLGKWLWSQLLPGQGENTPLAIQSIDAIQALAWSPDSQRLIMAGTRIVKLWQVSL
ncbi:hypothetical protein [Thermogemmatispora sp.]|uniref:hypothetical protein n=1 Tax=Thermogemmatispora sp. TaxID=1968838 RepID=UPI001E0C49E8|nr:hypothetical protein [Thermogemmatispora sp.]MBX5450476.1 hypothetical protein [Thermogemmatispora sp.]